MDTVRLTRHCRRSLSPERQVMRSAVHILALLALAPACSNLKYVAPNTDVRSIDFSEYTRQGFMFTTETYQGAYESVGIIYVTMHAEGKLEDVKGFPQWVFSDLKVQDALAEAHRKALAMGANAIVKLDIQADNKVLSPVLAVPGIEVSGFAIRRAVVERSPTSSAPTDTLVVKRPTVEVKP